MQGTPLHSENRSTELSTLSTCYVSGLVLSALYTLSYFTLSFLWIVGTLIILVFQMNYCTSVHRTTVQVSCAQGNEASRWQNQNSNPDVLALEPEYLHHNLSRKKKSMDRNLSKIGNSRKNNHQLNRKLSQRNLIQVYIHEQRFPRPQRATYGIICAAICMWRQKKNVLSFKKITFFKKSRTTWRWDYSLTVRGVKYGTGFMSRSVNFMFCAFHKVTGN